MICFDSIEALREREEGKRSLSNAAGIKNKNTKKRDAEKESVR